MLRTARREIAFVYGNCQAEAVREILAESPEFVERYELVRIPGVHELTSSTFERVQALARRAALIVAQPVSAGYGGRSAGTDEILALAPAQSEAIRFPVLYHAGIYPFQVYVHVEGRSTVDAPITTYHDLRHLCASARGMPLEDAVEWVTSFSAPLESISARSEEGLAYVREGEDGTEIKLVDAITADPARHARSFHTVNHPSRELLELVALAVHEFVGLTWTPSAGPEPLDTIITPLEPPVIEALGLHAEPRRDWTIDGRVHDHAEIARAHLDWYATHPDVVTAGLSQSEALIARYGLLDG